VDDPPEKFKCVQDAAIRKSTRAVRTDDRYPPIN
jgi:hypothetical protein